MGGRGSGGHNKKSIEQHIIEGTFRKKRHLKEYLQYKDEFKNDEDELWGILDEMEKLCLGEKNGKPNIFEKKFKDEELNYYFTKTLMTKATEKRKKELESEFISKWKAINEKYGYSNIYYGDINKIRENPNINPENYFKYHKIFGNLWSFLVFGDETQE